MKETLMYLSFAVILFSTLACSNPDEREAKILYERAEQFRDMEQFDQSIRILQRISVDYSDTQYADLAGKEIAEYENLEELRQQNIRRKVNDRFSQIGMALENYRTRFLAFPLTPKDLEKLPTFVVPDWDDYWGNQIYYAPIYSSDDIPPHAPDGYALATFGEDGLPGGDGPDQDHFYKSGKVVASLTK